MCYFFLFPPKQIRIRVCNLHPGPEVDTHAIFHAFPCTSFGHDISIFCLLQEWRENKTSYIIWPSGNSPVCYGTPSFLVGKYVVNHLWNSINAYIILYIYMYKWVMASSWQTLKLPEGSPPPPSPFFKPSRSWDAGDAAWERRGEAGRWGHKKATVDGLRWG
jgi:hypothetical protein